MKKSSSFVLSFLVISGLSIGNAASTLYLPAMPSIAKSLNITPDLVKNSLSIFLAGYAISQLFYGPLSDAFGRRVNLTIGLLIFMFGSLLCSIAESIHLFLIGRAIEGIGIGACGAVGYSLMRDIYSGHKLTVIFGYISIFVGMIPLIAPIIGGYIVTYIGWRACFYLLTILSFLLLAGKFMYLHETILLKNPAACSPKVVFRNYKKLLCSREYICPALAAAFGFGGIFCIGSILPFILVNSLKIPPSVYGWIAGVPSLGYLAGSFLSGKCARLISIRRILLLGAIFSGIGLLIGIMMNRNEFDTHTVIAPLVIFMFGLGFLVPTGSAGAMSPFPELSGSQGALLTTFMFSFASLLTTIASKLNMENPVNLFILLTIIPLAAFIITKIKIEKMP